MKSLPNVIIIMVFALFQQTVFAQQPLYQNSTYALYADSVVQGKYSAKALSSSHIVSNYESPANEFLSPTIHFKFSINRKDNEMRPGVNHTFNCIPFNGKCETPVIQFGEQLVDNTPVPAKTYLAPNTSVTIKLDMRNVLASFKKDGYFTTFNGDKIYAVDFKELYVAGETEPMTWDFDNLHYRSQLEMKDPDGDGIYETTVVLNEVKKEKDLAGEWQLSKDISAFPQYHSSFPMADAIYNMSVEEMIKAVEPDSTFRTGKEWAGVWTRDISYSIILSMAYLQPRVAKYSLLKKVKNGKIIQDTGTGGAYPNSTDRMIWAVAAWELYKATGDMDWLKQAYAIIKKSVDDDILNAHDKVTGMVRGESSFLDWREQTYPKWMQPADIFESECLGTNAVHFKASSVLSEMATLLNKPADSKKYSAIANNIKQGMNKYLWMADKGYYAQYLYGRTYKMPSPKSEALGEALTVLFGIADSERAKQVMAKTPQTSVGISCIFPHIDNIPPYHNNAVWPFVQSYWAQAAAKAGNEEAVLASFGAIYRPAALFLTNKENFVADNGDYKGTVINSSNMLWSLSGNISLVHKILFGIEYKTDGLLFHPYVPYQLNSKRSLTNFTYRKALLDIELEGFGNVIKSFSVDGKLLPKTFIPATITGKHSIKIVLTDAKVAGVINEIKNHTALPTPNTMLNERSISWDAIEGAVSYKIIRNGSLFATTNKPALSITDSDFAEYQVIAVDAAGYESFASQPLTVNAASHQQLVEAETLAPRATYNYQGAAGFIEISNIKNKMIQIPVTVETDAVYSIDFRYANGNGPSNTENKCAIRTLKLANKFIGTIIFPQRGVDEWSNWGYSNAVQVAMKKGKNMLTLSFEPANENMNVDINQAMIDYIRITKIR